MARLALAAVLAAALALPATGQAQGDGAPTAAPRLVFAPERLTARRDSFVAIARTGTVGYMRAAVSRSADGAVRYVEEVDVDGVMESLALTRLAPDLTMRQSQQSGEAAGVDLALDLLYATGRITGIASTLGASGARLAAIDTTVGVAVLDLNALSAVLPAVAWGEGGRGRVETFSPLAGGLVPLDCVVVGREGVDVPAGHFDVWRVRVSGTGTTSDYLITAAAPYRIVHVQTAGVPFAFALAR